MFSIAWGDVSYRDRMVVSTQEVYRRLLLQSPDQSVLKFEVLAMAAMKSNGTLDEQKLQALIHLLRPDRDGRLFVIVVVVRNRCLQPETETHSHNNILAGNLSLLDFIKSVDQVYKEAKLLRASVKNSEKIDRAFENCTLPSIFEVREDATMSSTNTS